MMKDHFKTPSSDITCPNMYALWAYFHIRNVFAKHVDGLFDILLKSVIKDGTSKERT